MWAWSERLLLVACVVLTVTVGYSFVQRQKHGNNVLYDRIENVGVGVALACVLLALVLGSV